MDVCSFEINAYIESGKCSGEQSSIFGIDIAAVAHNLFRENGKAIGKAAVIIALNRLYVKGTAHDGDAQYTYEQEAEVRP